MTNHFGIGSDLREVVIARENSDTLVFDQIKKAERYIEPIDVYNDEYVIYDGQARRLNAVVLTDRSGHDRVKIEPSPDRSLYAAELRQILAGLLTRAGYNNEELERKELDYLVRECLQFKRE